MLYVIYSFLTIRGVAMPFVLSYDDIWMALAVLGAVIVFILVSVYIPESYYAIRKKLAQTMKTRRDRKQ